MSWACQGIGGVGYVPPSHLVSRGGASPVLARPRSTPTVGVAYSDSVYSRPLTAQSVGQNDTQLLRPSASAPDIASQERMMASLMSWKGRNKSSQHAGWWCKHTAGERLAAIRNDPDGVQPKRPRKCDVSKVATIAEVNGVVASPASSLGKRDPGFWDGSPAEHTFISASPYVKKAVNFPSHHGSSRWRHKVKTAPDACPEEPLDERPGRPKASKCDIAAGWLNGRRIVLSAGLPCVADGPKPFGGFPLNPESRVGRPSY